MIDYTETVQMLTNSLEDAMRALNLLEELFDTDESYHVMPDYMTVYRRLIYAIGDEIQRIIPAGTEVNAQ